MSVEELCRDSVTEDRQPQGAEFARRQRHATCLSYSDRNRPARFEDPAFTDALHPLGVRVLSAATGSAHDLTPGADRLCEGTARPLLIRVLSPVTSPQMKRGLSAVSFLRLAPSRTAISNSTVLKPEHTIRDVLNAMVVTHNNDTLALLLG